MATTAELSDDSALINAFDDAMSKYKIMHNKGDHESLNEGSKVMSSTGENVSSFVEESHGAKRHLKADDNSNGASNSAPEVGETADPLTIKDDHCVESCAPQCHLDSSNDLNTEDALKGHSNSQSSEDYTQLLNQYYELEEKRQQIIWQLHQFGYENYQHSGENTGAALQWDAQDYQVPVNQASHSTAPYVSQSTLAPSTSLPACSQGETCSGNTYTDASPAVGPENTFLLKNDDAVATAMGAAERAISSMKMKISELENEGEQHERKTAEGTSSETDITVVLNAWYSAGFFTAKYLMEQSISKKRHG